MCVIYVFIHGTYACVMIITQSTIVLIMQGQLVIIKYMYIHDVRMTHHKLTVSSQYSHRLANDQLSH